MKKELDLGREKIGTLLLKFSIPCVISMLVASLYNIVDQIYIGHISGIDTVSNIPVSILCNGATNVVYPFTLIALAICLLIGDGSASLFSLSCGKKDSSTANKSIGNGLVLQIICFLFVTILGFVFSNRIVRLFGASTSNYKYAMDYFKIIMMGIPAYMFGQGLNSAIRADGSPKFAMFATTIGAILNIILDPLFIFTFDMGIKGAAIATIIGQYVTCFLTIFYLFKSKIFKINKDSIKLDFSLVKRIILLGISSFVTQISIVIIIAVCNNLISYINDVKYGIDIPLAVIGIVMKVFGIVVSICIGIALGGSPIIGYNYGAGNSKRVKEAYKDIVISCSVVGIVATLIFQFCPNVIINLFGKNNSLLYNEYAYLCMRIYLATILITCLLKVTSIFLQSIGSSTKSMIIAVSRDVLFFVPIILLIGHLSMNVVSILYSAIITDILTLILTCFLLKKEFNKIESTNIVIDYDDEIVESNKLNKHIIITISREYGSGGRYVGKILSEILGIKFYDKELIHMIAKSGDFSDSYVIDNEQKKNGVGYVNDDKLFIAEDKVIKNLAKKESCIIVGRCADYILKDNKNVLNVFLYSDNKSKINRVTKYYGLNSNEALKTIKKIDNERSRHYKYYTNRNWKELSNYDIALNVDSVGVEETAKLIADIVINKK